MEHRNTSEVRALRGTRRIAWGTALAVALTVALAQPAHAKRVTPPPVPGELEVDAGSKAFLVGHASGTQNYVCLPLGNGYAWNLFTPEATLFNHHGKQLTTHFFSPNPVENGIVRAAWQHSRDTSSVWGQVVAFSSNADFVAPGAIPWLLIKVVGTEPGPTGGDAMGRTTQIQRLNTTGGVAPSTGCAASTDVGSRVFVPYTADYYFYSHPASEED